MSFCQLNIRLSAISSTHFINILSRQPPNKPELKIKTDFFTDTQNGERSFCQRLDETALDKMAVDEMASWGKNIAPIRITMLNFASLSTMIKQIETLYEKEF